MKNITMFTLFSGYESQMMGLLDAVKKFNNRFKAELVGWCEIDKAARLGTKSLISTYFSILVHVRVLVELGHMAV